MNEKKRYALMITGIVQGVGFRPYIYRLALELGLFGWVLNSPQGVEACVEGDDSACAAFLARLRDEAPPASRIDQVSVSEQEPLGEIEFCILPSRAGERRTLISPDLAICEDCLRELKEAGDRRYRYPFINCTNCGPRFTITEGLPYDRMMTTMKDFPLCEACHREYLDPQDRRFHAQPNACAVCGPALAYFDEKGQRQPGDPLDLARQVLKKGGILAVKGLGGYHLACDAENESAVQRLRQRKLRWHKPFALMMPDLEWVRHYCLLNEVEEQQLQGKERPIMLLRKQKSARPLASQIGPGQKRLGVMLPYTPLHYLLIEGFCALVMTSANLCDEPIVHEDEELFSRLTGLADAYLTHNRPIFRRIDDSVAVYAAGAPRLWRRARGYAPEPLKIRGGRGRILALGGQEKNTFCLTRGEEALISQHIGDLDDAATYRQYRSEISYYQQMFEIQPELVACDMHPDYLTSHFALETGLPLLRVQHHHAHLASVLAEHDLKGPALGLIFDGTGYGLDGRLWGGEVLYGDCARFERLAHLRYLPLPGGAAAIREPWRLALAALNDSCGSHILAHEGWRWPEGWQTVLQSIEQDINTPLSSGMGRLFDAVAALAGLYQTVSYEGQAAIGLEQAIDKNAEGSYRFAPQMGADGALELDWRPVIAAAAADLRGGAKAPLIAIRFHRALAELCLRLAQCFGAQYGLNRVVLSGGCWQNIWLLETVCAELSEAGFQVYANSAVPSGDGGLSFGQAAVAAAQYRRFRS